MKFNRNKFNIVLGLLLMALIVLYYVTGAQICLNPLRIEFPDKDKALFGLLELIVSIAVFGILAVNKKL